MANRNIIDNYIKHDRDFDFDYFGYKTLEKSYLLKVDGVLAERPQHMFMRVALGIHGADISAAFETYDLMSQRYFVHASPTLFNAGTPRPQLSSCFLLTIKEDSIEVRNLLLHTTYSALPPLTEIRCSSQGIFDTLSLCATISKFAGGIGVSVQNVRATNSYVRGSNGTSNGLVPMLRVFNDTARYVDQGGGKRKGSFAVYLEVRKYL